MSLGGQGASPSRPDSVVSTALCHGVAFLGRRHLNKDRKRLRKLVLGAGSTQEDPPGSSGGGGRVTDDGQAFILQGAPPPR